MSGQPPHDAPPPEVPEEFAAAYLEAFHRALAEGEGRVGAHQAAAGAVPELSHEASEPDPPAEGPRHRVTEYRTAAPMERLVESRAFLPVVVALAALLLVGGAYGLGKAFSPSTPQDASATPADPSSDDSNEPSAPATDATSAPGKPGPWRGKVSAAKIGSVSATCTMGPGRDAAGQRVSYRPENTIDGRPETAWRCAGEAIGERLVLTLPAEVSVGQVGLVPGYAKTDPRSGDDRYAENNRITSVRWTLASGVVVEQRLNPATHRRSIQLLRVPPTETKQIVLEILQLDPGPRNTTAVSEIVVGRVS